MCGIAGFVNIDNILIDNIHNSLNHRGPDAKGSFIDDNISIIHNRLAIQDLSENASQPMLLNEHVIVLNGEIYNHLELRDRLSEYRFKSNSDTETLLYLFIKYGTNCLKELDGMFAFVIMHIPSRKLFFARDRAGKKPLYYFQEKTKFFFASELQTIRKNISLSINEMNINAFLRNGFFYNDQTPFENVNELPAGSYAYLNTHTMHFEIKKWWDIEYFYNSDFKPSNLQDAVEEVDFLLNLAVKRRLDSSDLEVGSFLSGGIDSGLITAISSQQKRKIKTFTVAFEDQYDESNLAKFLVKEYDLNHTVIHINYNNLINDIEKILSNYGEPFSDSSAIPSYYVSLEAKKYLTVILNGDGGDELFGGYRRYVPFSKINLFNLNNSYRSFLRYIATFFPYPDEKLSYYNYIYRLVSLCGKENILDMYLSATSDIFEDYLYCFDNPEFGLKPISSFLENTKIIYPNGLNAIMCMDFNCILSGDLLVKMDIANMAHALEGRSPFLSKELLEFAPTLPADYKISKTKTKYILRELARKYLPEIYINQPKRGFEVPLKQWVDNELCEIIFDYLHEPKLVSNFIRPKFINDVLNKKILMPSEKRAKILWSLFVTEVWYRNCVNF